MNIHLTTQIGCAIGALFSYFVLGSRLSNILLVYVVYMLGWYCRYFVNKKQPDNKEFLEWLIKDDSFNIPEDEIEEILEDYKTYKEL